LYRFNPNHSDFNRSLKYLVCERICKDLMGLIAKIEYSSKKSLQSIFVRLMRSEIAKWNKQWRD